jgi:membrane protease YdiL (CAAX protease family)
MFVFGRFGLPSMAVLGIARLLEITLFVLIFRRFGDQGTAEIGLNKGHFLHGLQKGAVWSVGFGVLVAAAYGLLLLLHINLLDMMKAEVPGTVMGILLFFLIGSLISPVAEEIFFRGVLYGFCRRWGISAALVISTLFFVLAHASAHRIPFPQIVGGILFALAYEKEKNLVVPITIHILGNLAIFTLALAG